MNKTTRLSERSPFPVAVRAAGLLVLLLSALAGGQRQGAARQATLPPQQLTASDVAAFAAFGVAVALSGTTAVVGAYLANGFLGEAYVFIDRDEGVVARIQRCYAPEKFPGQFDAGDFFRRE